ncbi:putative tRNA sulfurtransferase [endosymbiont DhMRE of Dentiscutata heterogama]|uniref:tRNA uracil 4-sulfurtransferase ThiI n=1 Tax=endosymbiont DhMRE of Dentiscutata heterogama TaxID=1609546 RepID=UPI000629DB48|nr:tRNA uracil 4-sulfurtransferase ThiI [endosymbiont DhMRE of Dentiscutata heterogama]CFW93450.1 putative tRNA sulfurtransferase [endosymbiont DhMRE of Dentiscutata heterogama]
MNNRCLIVRYGELFLKGKNRNVFIQKLIANIILTFQKNDFFNFKIKKLHDQLIITNPNDNELPKMASFLNQVFGISTFYLAYQLKNDLEEVYNFAGRINDYCQINFTTFKFDIRRSDKTFSKNSLTLQKELGAIVVRDWGLKVDLKQPQKVFYIRIYQDFIIFFTEKMKGLGGLPVGVSGRVLLLLSGGIDSPVAAYQLMKRGLQVDYCHFYHQKEGQNKILALGEKLSPYNNYARDVYLIDAQPLFTEISHIRKQRIISSLKMLNLTVKKRKEPEDEYHLKYRLIILKRAFVRLACSLAQELKIGAIATGDSLAQVASQTLESLAVIHQVSSLIILCPLLTWDKKEIIATAEDIGTYELSLQKYEDCCSLFEPKNPITKPKKEVVEKLEKKIFFWSEILESVRKKIRESKI